MGGSKFLGKDCGIPHTKEGNAFEIFCIWLFSGWVVTFTFTFIFLEPSFKTPILLYLVGVVILFVRYLRIELKGGLKDGKRTRT